MLIDCEVPETLPAIVSAAGPIDYAPAAPRRLQREWKYSLGGMAVLAAAMFLLVLLTDEAMGGEMLLALLHSMGHG